MLFKHTLFCILSEGHAKRSLTFKRSISLLSFSLSIKWPCDCHKNGDMSFLRTKHIIIVFIVTKGAKKERTAIHSDRSKNACMMSVRVALNFEFNYFHHCMHGFLQPTPISSNHAWQITKRVPQFKSCNRVINLVGLKVIIKLLKMFIFYFLLIMLMVMIMQRS